jgi:alkanesulfonate monooxygenase SsuD/methylene tetrahydromethanopterin reductase-like flavin-dependent oxidoreductase (luciferase family)
MIAGFWALPIIGSPDQIAEKLVALHRAGLDGIALSWPDYQEGLGQLEHEILPLLVQAGVRRPAQERVPAAAPPVLGS